VKQEHSRGGTWDWGPDWRAYPERRGGRNWRCRQSSGRCCSRRRSCARHRSARCSARMLRHYLAGESFTTIAEEPDFSRAVTRLLQ